MCRTIRFVCGRGATRDAHSAERVEKVQVRYHIGSINEYTSHVTMHTSYPDAPDVDQILWPVAPQYYPPSNYISENIRRDFIALDNRAFRGEACEPLIESVKEWDQFPF